MRRLATRTARRTPPTKRLKRTDTTVATTNPVEDSETEDKSLTVTLYHITSHHIRLYEKVKEKNHIIN